MLVSTTHQGPMLAETPDYLSIVSNDSVPVLTMLQIEYNVARTRSGACTSPPTVPTVRTTGTRRGYRSTPTSPIREPSLQTLEPLVERDALTPPFEPLVRSDDALCPFT